MIGTATKSSSTSPLLRAARHSLASTLSPVLTSSPSLSSSTTGIRSSIPRSPVTGHCPISYASALRSLRCSDPRWSHDVDWGSSVAQIRTTSTPVVEQFQGRIASMGKFEERQATVDHTSLVISGLLPMYRNAYKTCFQNRMIHNLVERAKQSDEKPVGQFESYSSVAGTPDQKTSANQESGGQANVLRPLSPHLPVYQAQINSTLSILNRISASFLSVMVTSFYLIYLKLGPVCLSFENFYQFLFYSSKLTLFSLELTVLALVYHVYAGVRHLFMDFSGNLLGKAGKKH